MCFAFNLQAPAERHSYIKGCVGRAARHVLASSSTVACALRALLGACPNVEAGKQKRVEVSLFAPINFEDRMRGPRSSDSQKVSSVNMLAHDGP